MYIGMIVEGGDAVFPFFGLGYIGMRLWVVIY